MSSADQPAEVRSALVHSMESCGVFDGPGLRTVIFLQGCKLRCLYCHNPDTWAIKGHGEEMSIEQLMGRLEQFKPYMDTNGGGVTVSGGEPLLQKRFLINFFKELKAKGFHTCIDTNGMVHLDELTDELIELTDLFLLDLKVLDREQHIKLTAKPNDLPLAFLEHLHQKQQKLWLRYVIVPGYTDGMDAAKAYADRVAKYRQVIERVELLPFHQMGAFKFEQLGIKYMLEGVEPPSAEVMESLGEIFKDRGFKVTVG